MKTLFGRLAALVAATMLLAGAPGASQAESTWEHIKSSGELKFAVFSYPPYFVKDKSTNEWGGALVEMAKDVAKELKVNLNMVEVGGWSELVLAISTGKVDMAAGMQATPVRATAIDFAGPIYWIEWVTVNNKNFSGKDWADYNDPKVKVAVMTGTSDQLLLEKWAPKAAQVQFKELSGTFNNPKPRAALPGYFGIRSEEDPKFKNFLNWWAEWNNLLGHNERRMKEAMLKYSGITEIPDSVSFAP
jgi:polar amino acid transport system substrate-binding protein